MSGWGYDDGGEAEATPDAWGAAPTTTRPAVVSNLRDSAVGALFSPDEPSPNEWCGAGYRGRWGVGDGHEDRGDGDDAGGWGGDETFGDGDDAHDWGRSDVVDDDGMSVGAAEDAKALVKKFKKILGSGGALAENGSMAFQGDNAALLVDMLRAMGYKRAKQTGGR